MTWLYEHAPLLFSPTAWGIAVTATLVYLKAKGFMDELTATWLAEMFGAWTGVNIIWKSAKKVAGK